MSADLGEGDPPAGRPKIRVLWLIKGLGPGGAERLLVSSARVGDHERFAYSVAYVRADKALLAADLARCGVSSRCLGGGRGGSITWPSRLRRLLRSEPFDFIHLHSPLVAGVTRLVVITLPRAERPKLISTEHNTWDSFGAPTRWLNALTAPLDTKRWAVSRRVRDSMWPSRRTGVSTLVHGLVLDDAEPSEGARVRVRAALGLGDDQVAAVTVANFRTEKAYPNLLQAASIALARDPKLRFVAIGQGPLEAEVRSLHDRLGLADRFQLLGYRDDVMDVLAASDLFVLGSLHEGFPIAIMEALAAGLPVVATDVGGVPDAITEGEEGFLVPPARPDLLAAAILRVSTDPQLRRRMADTARAQGPRYDVRIAVTEIERAYLELAGS